MLELDAVRVTFPQTVAVDDVSMRLAEGGVLAVLGPSGCGKSTLLRAVAGLEPLAGGAVRWRGTDLAPVPTHRRGFALMFQDGQLFAHATAGDNIAYPLRLRGVPRARRRQRAEELLELVGLPGYADRRPATLSGGQQQRVALARALAAEPALLLLDEPLSSLDRSLRDRLAGDLRDILTTTGTTAMLVTHDHDEAFTVADRVAVMLAGRTAQEGPTGQVWSSPVSREVAEFIGYQTFLTGGAACRVVAAGGGPDASGAGAGATLALRRAALRQRVDGLLHGEVSRALTVSDAVHLEVDVDGVGRCHALGDHVGVQIGDRVQLAVDPRGLASLPD
ncbi:ABC transporter ATP-binding protein [Serinicoccus sp. LYQ131]|uniref:ABC transporter ATP-binding protein n=1 Tax=Serinicoccus sp. LYQ131 TaxID=3378797 RepID=UPI0038521A29